MIRPTLRTPLAIAFQAALTIACFATFNSRAFAQTSGTWALSGGLNIPRTGHTATLLLNGQVLFAGGEDASGVLASAELYNPATGKWTSTGSLTTARISHSATLLGTGSVLVAGGNNATGILSSAEIYTPSTGQWKGTGSMSTARALQGAVFLQRGQVLVAAGNSNTAELYGPSTGTWHGTGAPQSNHLFSLTLLMDGRALAVDDSGSSGATGELYNPSTGQWSLTGSMYYAHTGNSIALLTNGDVLAYGTTSRVMPANSSIQPPTFGPEPRVNAAPKSAMARWRCWVPERFCWQGEPSLQWQGFLGCSRVPLRSIHQRLARYRFSEGGPIRSHIDAAF